MAAITLAAALSEGGWRVALADADPQGSALKWAARRPKGVAKVKALDWSGASLKIPKSTDWLIVDSPGGLGRAETGDLVAETKVILMAVMPSVFDAGAAATFHEDLGRFKRVRKGKAGVAVLANRVRPRTRALARLRALLDEIGAPPLAEISERSVYDDLAVEGLALFDSRLKTHAGARAQWRPVLEMLLA
ncbi:hypothetical protein CCR78_13665 [Rhodovulum imhoffii]|nr:hypothetical protein [Rhodovulum imhoffii]